MEVTLVFLLMVCDVLVVIVNLPSRAVYARMRILVHNYLLLNLLDSQGLTRTSLATEMTEMSEGTGITDVSVGREGVACYWDLRARVGDAREGRQQGRLRGGG